MAEGPRVPTPAGHPPRWTSGHTPSHTGTEEREASRRPLRALGSPVRYPPSSVTAQREREEPFPSHAHGRQKNPHKALCFGTAPPPHHRSNQQSHERQQRRHGGPPCASPPLGRGGRGWQNIFQQEESVSGDRPPARPPPTHPRIPTRMAPLGPHRARVAKWIPPPQQ